MVSQDPAFSGENGRSSGAHIPVSGGSTPPAATSVASRPRGARQPGAPTAGAATHRSAPAKPSLQAGDPAAVLRGIRQRGIVGLSLSSAELTRAGELMALIERDLPHLGARALRVRGFR